MENVNLIGGATWLQVRRLVKESMIPVNCEGYPLFLAECLII